MLCLDKIIISNDDFATYNTLLSGNGLYLERNDKKARIVINPGYGIQIDKNVGTSESPTWNNTLYIDSNGELKLNTYDTTISTLDGKITNNSSAISINSQQISSVVSSVSSLDGRVSSAESSIIQNANAITSKVSSTDYNGNRIVSLINQSSSKINMSALNINLSGMVTFNELDDYLAEAGSTTINGANITTGTISANSIRGGIITGVTIDVNTDATIGNKLRINGINYGAGIKWDHPAFSPEIYIDPASQGMFLVSGSGIYANNKRIDVAQTAVFG